MGLLCWCIDQLHILDNVHLYLLSCHHNRVMAVIAGFQGYMSITRIKSVIWYSVVMVYKKYFQKAHKDFSFLTRTNAAHIEVRLQSACQPQTGDPAKERGHFRASQQGKSAAS